jgi:hypothetical protein
MKIFRRGTQRKQIPKLGDIDILLKGYVVSPSLILGFPFLRCLVS